MDEAEVQAQAQLASRDDAGAAGEHGLTCDAILTVEYQYIAQTVFQANEDRSRVTSFYLVTLGSFIAAIFSSTQISNLDRANAYAAFALLFAVLVAMSVLTLLQILRLREAWFESAAALNTIKAFYIRQSKKQDLGSAFRWKPDGLTGKFKIWSVGFLLALQVAVLGGACAGGGLMFAGLAVDPNRWLWAPAAIFGTIVAAGQVLLYWLVLQRSRAGS